MEQFLVLLGIFLFAVLVVLPIWTIVKITRQGRDQDVLQRQITALQQEVQALRAEIKTPPTTPAQPAFFTAPPPAFKPVTLVVTPPAPPPEQPAGVTPPPIVTVAPAPATEPMAEPPLLTHPFDLHSQPTVGPWRCCQLVCSLGRWLCISFRH